MAPVNNANKDNAIVVGYEGSESSVAAVRDLARAGLGATGNLLVVTAVDHEAIPVGAYSPAAASVGDFNWSTPESWDQVIEEAKQHGERTAAEGAELARSVLPGWNVQCKASIESPHWTLIAEADRDRSSMIVVGSHGRSALGRAFLGSTSQFVLNHANRTVRIGRGSNTPPGSPLRMVIAVDGSAQSIAAASEVARRKWPAGTAVRVVAAVDLRFVSSPSESPAPWIDLLSLRDDEYAAAPRRVVESACELFEGTGLTVTPAVEEGDPKRVIVKDAERWGADAIFLGAKGHSAVERVLLGSVSATVAARAHCSVEVVRGVSESHGGRGGK